MVSIHTAHQIRKQKKVSRQKAKSTEYKSIFHKDMLPATVGMFGFIISFALFSLSIGISPFVNVSMPGRQVEMMVGEGVNCNSINDQGECIDNSYYASNNDCVWISNSADGNYCKNSNEVTCENITYWATCDDRKECGWISMEDNGNYCKDLYSYSCEQILEWEACQKKGCAWISSSGRGNYCRDINTVSCEQIKEDNSCANKENCAWTSTSGSGDYCFNANSLSCEQIKRYDSCANKGDCVWISGEGRGNYCIVREDVGCSQIKRRFNCSIEENCNWINPDERWYGDYCRINKPETINLSDQLVQGVREITWTAVIGANKYLLRINDQSNGWNSDGTCNGVENNLGDICRDVSTNSFSYDFKGGHNYSIWVHAVDNMGVEGEMVSKNISVISSNDQSYSCSLSSFKVNGQAIESISQLMVGEEVTLSVEATSSSPYKKVFQYLYEDNPQAGWQIIGEPTTANSVTWIPPQTTGANNLRLSVNLFSDSCNELCAAYQNGYLCSMNSNTCSSNSSDVNSSTCQNASNQDRCDNTCVKSGIKVVSSTQTYSCSLTDFKINGNLISEVTEIVKGEPITISFSDSSSSEVKKVVQYMYEGSDGWHRIGDRSLEYFENSIVWTPQETGDIRLAVNIFNRECSELCASYQEGYLCSMLNNRCSSSTADVNSSTCQNASAQDRCDNTCIKSGIKVVNQDVPGTPIVTPTPSPNVDCYSCSSNQCIFDTGCQLSGPRCESDSDCVTPTPTPLSCIEEGGVCSAGLGGVGSCCGGQCVDPENDGTYNCLPYAEPTPTPSMEPITTPPGAINMCVNSDLNNDGIVNIYDYKIFREDYRANNLRSDINRDRVVDEADYQAFKDSYFCNN